MWIGAGVALSSGTAVYTSYLQGGALLNPTMWVPLQIHQGGIEIRNLLAAQGSAGPADKVLTLMPLFPLEGGLSIYPALASGPFTWRVAPLLSDDQRARLGVVGAGDLALLVGRDTPAAILTGGEAALESELTRYAQTHHYRAVRLSNGLTLWLK